MDFEEEFSTNETEVGSDELLSDDSIRLPDSANPLVRLHAVKAWLTRRQKETTLEMSKAALDWQTLQQTATQDSGRMRRREQQQLTEQLQRAEHSYQMLQEKLNAYEQAEQLLEDCLAHTTSSERTLVEYYLLLEEMVGQEVDNPDSVAATPHQQAFTDVQHRVEQVGAPQEAE
ncbi:MAG TPA: hypothetical protein VHZ51_03975 [Ktedonobacteraceae bacterium]|nr:hypothetical protein [Ktedonobacteraceae bacterium]